MNGGLVYVDCPKSNVHHFLFQIFYLYYTTYIKDLQCSPLHTLQQLPSALVIFMYHLIVLCSWSVQYVRSLLYSYFRRLLSLATWPRFFSAPKCSDLLSIEWVGFFFGGGGVGVKVASAKFRLRMSGSVPCFALYAFLEWTETILSFNGHELCLA